MNFYHFRPSCKVIKRSRLIKGPVLPSYGEEVAMKVRENEEKYIEKGELKLDMFGMHSNYSRKVFVGGLPSDTKEGDMLATFSPFGALAVDWPYKDDTNSITPPKGFAFLLFKENSAVDGLMLACELREDGYFYSISSAQMKNKTIQVRPWKISGIDHIFSPLKNVNERNTVFVGGVPRTLNAEELGNLMVRLFGKVNYVGIDTDSEYMYPKGSARVVFEHRTSVVNSVRKRFVMPAETMNRKMMEVKPYILDDQVCDKCVNNNKYDQKVNVLFCPDADCLLYLCEFCWIEVHSTTVSGNHKPMVKQGLDDYMNSLRRRGLEC